MTEPKQKRPAWKSPFKMGLLVLCGLAYAPACIFEQQVSGDSEWFYFYLIVFVGSYAAAVFDPVRCLDTAAMPSLAVLIVGFTGLGGPFFLVTMIFVLAVAIPAALLGSASRLVGSMIFQSTQRRKGTHNKSVDTYFK